MINFLKKQVNKIIIWILVVVLLLLLIGFIFKISVSILISTLSFVTSIFIGFLGKTWLEDYKIELNMELEKTKSELNKELEKYKIRLSGYTIVTKMQYELEFKIYTEIHGLVESHFRIVSDMIFQMENNKIKNRDKYTKKCNESSEKILSTMYRNKPFYQKEICNKISTINGLNSEIFHLYIDFSEKSLMKDDLVKKGKTIGDTLEELSDLIRNRIENMKIIED